MPFAIKDAISQELDRLEKQGTISPVTHSKLATPIVSVPKKDGKFRICRDYKVTVNQVLMVEEYPLPTPEVLFSTLAEGKLFSKLDLSQAYLQLPVNAESKQYLTINTHKGLYEDSHLQSLEEVFNCLEKHGFRLKLEKCEFLLKSIEYL